MVNSLDWPTQVWPNLSIYHDSPDPQSIKPKSGSIGCHGLNFNSHIREVDRPRESHHWSSQKVKLQRTQDARCWAPQKMKRPTPLHNKHPSRYLPWMPGFTKIIQTTGISGAGGNKLQLVAGTSGLPTPNSCLQTRFRAARREKEPSNETNHLLLSSNRQKPESPVAVFFSMHSTPQKPIATVTEKKTTTWLSTSTLVHPKSDPTIGSNPYRPEPHRDTTSLARSQQTQFFLDLKQKKTSWTFKQIYHFCGLMSCFFLFFGYPPKNGGCAFGFALKPAKRCLTPKKDNPNGLKTITKTRDPFLQRLRTPSWAPNQAMATELQGKPWHTNKRFGLLQTQNKHKHTHVARRSDSGNPTQEPFQLLRSESYLPKPPHTSGQTDPLPTVQLVNKNGHPITCHQPKSYYQESP